MSPGRASGEQFRFPQRTPKNALGKAPRSAGRVFKPHTGTKTSVLFFQKWNDDAQAGPLCPKVDDYPIFFATQKLESKDTSGEKIIAKDADGGPLRDQHGHWVVQHDLFNHDGLTQDGIAEAFAEFAVKEKLGFF